MYTRIRTLLFLIIICFATTSYVDAETWACSDKGSTFVMKRIIGQKFKVVSAKVEVDPLEIVSENSKNLVLFRKDDEQYLVMIINKQTNKFSWLTLNADAFLRQNSLGMGVTTPTSGKCTNY